MPGILNHEYTHGSQEQGADFILERRDETINEIDYISVIAKVGDITPSNASEVLRQIRESKIPKKFSGGKKNVSVTSFWVITTGKFTRNSQDLIHNEFPNLQIKLFPQHKLRSLIDSYYDSFWRNIPHEIAAKLELIQTTVRTLDQRMDLLPVAGDSFYVEQKLFRHRPTVSEKKTWKDERTEVNLIDLCKRKKFVFVEGDYGFGKSKLLRQTVKTLSRVEGYEEHGVIPHIAPFWDYIAAYRENPQNFISDKGFAFISEIADVRHIIFLDSFDEIKHSGEEQVDALKAIAESISSVSNISFVIASRPVSGTIRGAILEFDGELIEIGALSFNQVTRFLHHLCQSVRNQPKLISDLKSSPLYSDLPRSPISAILLGKLIAENHQDIPSTLPELYSKSLELAMGRWDQKKGLQTEKEYKAVSIILMKLAEYFIENNLTKISAEEARQRFVIYVQERNSDLNGSSLFDRTIERSDLLILDEYENSVQFKHRSYFEFLYAQQKRNEEGISIDNRVLDPYWSTIFYFYFGLKGDCEEILGSLTEIEPETLTDRWSMALNYPKYLMAASETRYVSIVPILEYAVVHFVRLYIDSRNGKTEFPKGELSRMQFLSIVTPFFQSFFGYSFFQRGLEEIAVRLDHIFKTPEERCCASFFISFARLGFNDPKVVDMLVEADEGAMPPEMQLIIAWEAKQKKCRSVPVKKYLKLVTRKLMTKPEVKGIPMGRSPAEELIKNVIR